MGCLMGAYTLVGFESAANLSEETVDAAATVPRAVIWSVVVSGAVGTLFLVLVTLGISDLAAVVNSDYPLPLIIESKLGKTMSLAFFGLVIVSVFACGLIIMASGSRLVYAMSRDGLFPASNLFRRISPVSSVPRPGGADVPGPGTPGHLLRFHHGTGPGQHRAASHDLPDHCGPLPSRRSQITSQFGTFTLGRWGPTIAIAAVCWLITIITILTIPESFRTTSLLSLGLCAAGLIPWFGWLRGRVNRGEAGPQSRS
ncbi:MAG: hypothetical protein CM1200mP2_12410 [Planctomycetaceae bacterium]|nr:MAG: hypothetical protein CM1200mP2_12410 [Planctomycetaceae bacterium]